MFSRYRKLQVFELTKVHFSNMLLELQRDEQVEGDGRLVLRYK